MADAAHAANNVLNSAAVNLSVVTTRLASPQVADSSGEALAGRTAEFAVHAADGLDSASELVQSMVALARPLPAAPDPARMVTDIMRVAVAGCRDGVADLVVDLRDPIVAPDQSAVVRLAIATGVRTLLREGQGGTVRWIGSEVVLARPAGSLPQAEPIVAAHVMRIVADAGFAVRPDGEVVTFSILEQRQH
jgi:hypothetical protein